MATADARDILGIANEAPRAPAAKSKKKALVDHGPRLKGMQREARALQGDSVPPVTLTEVPRYKERLNLPKLPARHWEQRAFVHCARSDGLTLKHWKRANAGFGLRHIPQIHGEDTEMQDDTTGSPTHHEYEFPEENYFARYDVSVPVPTYTTEQYEEKLKLEDWTKEETDYLLDLCRDFGLRWIVIADRYDPDEIPPTKENRKPSADTDSMAVDGIEVVQKYSYRNRRMEDLKARYYCVAAKMLEIQIPASNMTQVEFRLWETMRNFDFKTESTRKDLAEKLFERTKDEAEEERALLEELKRITMNEEEFLKMRRDLYARLEPPPTKRSNSSGEEQSTAMYQTSSGLSVLLQNLLAKEKRLKRPSVMPNGEVTPSSTTDMGNQRWEKGHHPNQYSRRNTLDSNDGIATGPPKKSSHPQPNTRTLTPAEELKYGVLYPQERLTSGVAFRHEKATKILQSKSSVQAQKISNALTELGIPARLGMPTESVCREFERLVQAIHLLLDTRKGVDKVSLEVKVLEEARRIRLGLPKDSEGGQETNGDLMHVDRDESAVQNVADPEAGLEVDNSQVEPGAEQKDDGQDDGEGAKVEQQEDQHEEGNQDEEDEENDEAEENASNTDSDDDDADQAQSLRKRRLKESSQISDAEDDRETGLGQDDEMDDGEGDGPGVDADDAGSNDDLGSENDVSDAEESVDENEEDDADKDEMDQEEDEEAEAEVEAEIEASEPPDSARPGSSHSAISRLKRSASVVSEASKAGSNRSATGRKKRR